VCYPHKIGRSTLVCGRRTSHFPYHIFVRTVLCYAMLWYGSIESVVSSCFCCSVYIVLLALCGVRTLLFLCCACYCVLHVVCCIPSTELSPILFVYHIIFHELYLVLAPSLHTILLICCLTSPLHFPFSTLPSLSLLPLPLGGS
jgi:hypothetical protein